MIRDIIRVRTSSKQMTNDLTQMFLICLFLTFGIPSLLSLLAKDQQPSQVLQTVTIN